MGHQNLNSKKSVLKDGRYKFCNFSSNLTILYYQQEERLPHPRSRHLIITF